jgi:hypothetical protein
MIAKLCGCLFCALVVLGTDCLSARAQGAGTYDVFGCTLPDGKKTFAIDGWSPIQTAPGGTQNACYTFSPPLNPALLAWLDPASGVPNGSLSGWTFRAPADTYVSGLRLYRYAQTAAGGDSSGGFGGRDWYVLRDNAALRPFDDHIMEMCFNPVYGCTGIGGNQAPYATTNLLESHGLQAHQIYAVVACDTQTANGSCNPTSPRAEFGLFSTDVELTDLRSPEITSGPTGSLLDASHALEGEKVLGFSASDKGGGLKALGVLIDGQSYADRAADPRSPTCTAPYTQIVPCPAGADVTIVVDTALLPNGRHVVQAAATDVGGNRTLSEPVVITTVNGSRPNGANASRSARLTAWFGRKSNRHVTHRTVRFGHRTSVAGVVRTTAGAPIADAEVEILSRASRRGSSMRRVGSVRTDGKGRFAWTTPRGASKLLRFGYRAATLDPEYASSADLRLGVRAKLTLGIHVTPGRARFAGRLVGGPGQLGTIVSLYAVDSDPKRRLIPVESVPVDRRGRFRYRYVFRTLTAPTRFRFQAIVRPQPSYPYALGRSRIVTVIARP